MKDFLAAPDLDEMKFAMFYETWNLGFNPPYEATPVTLQMELHFDSDMLASPRTTSRTSPISGSTGGPWCTCT